MTREKGANLLDEANKYIFVKHYEEGARLLEKLLAKEQHKDDLLIHLRRIELAAKLKNSLELQVEYKATLKTSPDDVTAGLAVTMLEQHNDFITPNDAIIIYQDIIKKFGPKAEAFYGIGFAFELLGNVERAIMNYDQALKIDPDWYPAYFGLSQLYYQMRDNTNGDRCFYLFEEFAPFNVYGNFNTHRRLALEFLEKEMYPEAETAIITLSEWWIENKGHCPPEVQIYEGFFLAKILDAEKQIVAAEGKRSRATMVAHEVLDDPTTSDGVIYFVAKSVEEFDATALAIKCYKKILTRQGNNQSVVQQIYGHFFATGQYEVARDIFIEAYHDYPDSPDVRFALIVANLKMMDVNIDEYLMLKERLKHFSDRPEARVELLSLVNELIALYDRDPDVHAIGGEVHFSLGDRERANHHFQIMYELDPLSRISRLKYAEFQMQYGDLEKGKTALDGISRLEDLSKVHLLEVHWLRAAYCFRTKEYEKSRSHLGKIYEIDPWNTSYLVLDVLNLTKIHNLDEEIGEKDTILEKLQKNNESGLDWDKYDAITKKIEELHQYEIVYNREKIRFLYASGEVKLLERLTQSAVKFNPARGMYDYLRLLNTNFDSSHIYWALGILAKEGWQLETACSWFEQVLLHPTSDAQIKARTYLDLADCYNWRKINFPKAIEYAKLSMELGVADYARAYNILAHIYLRQGNIREAQKFLIDTTGKTDNEMTYLRGLVQYRNGSVQKAKEIWKPLLRVPSQNLRFHYIKQELMGYYYERLPYMKNAS